MPMTDTQSGGENLHGEIASHLVPLAQSPGVQIPDDGPPAVEGPGRVEEVVTLVFLCVRGGGCVYRIPSEHECQQR